MKEAGSGGDVGSEGFVLRKAFFLKSDSFKRLCQLRKRRARLLIRLRRQPLHLLPSAVHHQERLDHRAGARELGRQPSTDGSNYVSQVRSSDRVRALRPACARSGWRWARRNGELYLPDKALAYAHSSLLLWSFSRAP